METAPAIEPKTGEQTRGQGIVSGVMSMIPGFGNPDAGTYKTYRLMRSNPTVAMARMAATAPIRAAAISFKEQADAPADAVEFIQEQIEPLWPLFVRNALFALDYGWKPFEKVFAAEGGRLVLRKLKPLRVDDTEVRLDKTTGAFMGLKNYDVELPPEKVLVFTHDGEDGDLYGRSRHENIRADAWQPWRDTLKRMGQYVTKSAGVIPMVRYPPGKRKDISGAERETHELAQTLLTNLGSGNGVLYPIEILPWAEQYLQAGGDASAIEKLMAWQIQFLEVPAGHGAEFIEMLRHFERLMLRGWLVPERTIAEGTTGTRADAQAHADVAIMAAQEVLGELIRHFNWHVVDQLLALNFGEDRRGSVVIEAAPLVDEVQQFIRGIIRDVLVQPANVDLLLRFLDLDAMLDQANLPKAEEVIDASMIEDRKPANPNNGNGNDGNMDDTGAGENDEEAVEAAVASVAKLWLNPHGGRPPLRHAVRPGHVRRNHRNGAVEL